MYLDTCDRRLSALRNHLLPLLPRKPYCTDDLARGIRPRQQCRAARQKYLQINPPHLCTHLIFDIDRPGGGLDWQNEVLPMPSWTAVNPANGHAHVAYALASPVLTADYGGSGRALRFAAAVQGRLRERLRADAGYSGLMAKNPLHSHWRKLAFIPRSIPLYDLADLAEYLDLEGYNPRRALADEEAAAGLGRNCHIFDAVRRWAYRHIRDYRSSATSQAWMRAVYNRCQNINCEFASPLFDTEIRAIAKSISKWTWAAQNTSASAEKFSALQSHRNSLRKTTTNAGRKPASILLLEGLQA